MGNCKANNFQQNEIVEFMEGDTYEGQMENGFAEGWGMYTRKNGDQYIGQSKWHNGFQHGQGKEIFADKTEYEGTFLEGKKDGRGKIRFPDGSSYEGQFQQDSFLGEGVYIYPNGMKLIGTTMLKLSLWIDNRKEGRAQLVFESGNIFECQYKSDMRNGESLLKWADGCSFESNWKDGQLQGESKLMEDGIMTIGEWLNNKCMKWEQIE